MKRTSDVRVFQADLARFAAKESAKATYLFRRVCSRVTDNVIGGGQYGPGTPVRSGFARNSWVTGINGPGQYVQPASPVGEGAGAGSAERRAELSTERLALGDTFFLTSNCVYQRRLDYGHSKQAPAGHVRLVMDQLKQIASDVVHEELPLFAGGGQP
jgi:hypothetical protein